MAQKKKKRTAYNTSSKSGKSSSRKRKSTYKIPEKKEDNSNVIISSTFLISVFILLVSVIEGERLWLSMHNLMHGLMGGVLAIIWPIFFIYISCKMALDRFNTTPQKNIMIGVGVMFAVSTLVYVFGYGAELTMSDDTYGRTLQRCYDMGVEDNCGPGLVGALLGEVLMRIFGVIGARITSVTVTVAVIGYLMHIQLKQVLEFFAAPAQKLRSFSDEQRLMKTSRKLDREKMAERKRADVIESEKKESKINNLFRPAVAQSFESEEDRVVSVPRNKNEKKQSEQIGRSAPQDFDISVIFSEEDKDAETEKEVKRRSKKSTDVNEEKQERGRKAAKNLSDEVNDEAANFEELINKATTADSDTGNSTGKDSEKTNDTTTDYMMPPVTLLNEPATKNTSDITNELRKNGELLVDTLKSFGVTTRIVDICRGPAATRYELQPAAGVKISRITSLADDIALNLAATQIRIEAPIPGKAAVGIEIPNKEVSVVNISEIINTNEFRSSKSKITFAVGKDIAGTVTVADLAKMPHLLIAGATNSGKSVCINSIIISILYKATPDEVKLVMIDPKMVELGLYSGIPHLVVPVVSDVKKAAGALGWAVGEMEKRYQLFADNNVRDIFGFNELAEKRDDLQKLPQYVIVIDELNDLMQTTKREVENFICRLAQKARAAGMHLIVATQRPSVDVITGVIKANVPSRIAFTVASQVDSRTILDASGADKLLGRGDMLFAPVGSSHPKRVQGCYVSDKEVERIVEFIKKRSETSYDAEVSEEIERQAILHDKEAASDKESDDTAASNSDDDILLQAIECIIDAGQASTSLLQRKLRLGYARAGRMIDELEKRGFVGPYEGSKPREVLITREQFMEYKMNSGK